MAAPNVVRVEDSPNWAAIRFNLDPARLELRVLRDVLGCTDLGISYLRLGAGAKLTVGHRHPGGEEVYVLVSGRAEAKVGDHRLALEPVCALRVPGHVFRGFRASGAEDAVFIVAGSIDDPDKTEIVPDFWPEL